MRGVQTMSVTDEQIILFWQLFKGQADAYGTYDPRTGRAWQVKEPVTAKVIRAHLQGQRPFGVYLLVKDRVHAIAADFDQDDPEPPAEFRRVAQDCGLPVYLERSKSKGYHAWTFFDGASGVPAAKARPVLLHLLRHIGRPQTEVFPKQDRLDDATRYGNFINAPLFGRLVPRGRSVFLDDDLEPVPDQWGFLRLIRRATEQAPQLPRQNPSVRPIAHG